MKNNKQFLGILGLAAKAGKIESGEFMTERAIKDHSAKLVIVAEDASAGTRKKFKNSCSFYHVPYACIGDKETLGRAVGRGFRASLAVTDCGFAQSIGKNSDLEVTEYGKNEDI